MSDHNLRDKFEPMIFANESYLNFVHPLFFFIKNETCEDMSCCFCELYCYIKAVSISQDQSSSAPNQPLKKFNMDVNI